MLINNAAIYKSRRELSTDGFELMFVTNHLGPFLLTHLLLDPLMTGGVKSCQFKRPRGGNPYTTINSPGVK